MSLENLTINPGAADQSCAVNLQTCDIVVLYGSDDAEKGYAIPAKKIDRITIVENMFSLLPTLTLKIDLGKIYGDINFQIGNTMYVSISANIDGSLYLPSPLLEGRFVIESVMIDMDMNRNTYIGTYTCIYSAEKYLNDICVWPKADMNIGKTTSIDKSYTSAEALGTILAAAGLAPSIEIETDDNMAWLNSTMTYSDFAQHIVNHAWVGDSDMPMLYVDRNGVAHYTSVNTLCEDSTLDNYIFQTRYQKRYGGGNGRKNGDVKAEPYHVYSDISLANYGYIQNNGGYNVKKYLFNPYSPRNVLPQDEFTQVGFDVVNPAARSKTDVCFRMKDFKDNGINGRQRLAAVSNRSVTQGETVRYHSVSTRFKQTHPYYDYAPLHHNSIRHSFFQQFAFLGISVTDQPGFEESPEQTLRLGKKIYIDMASVAESNSIRSGNFIVTGLTHDISYGSKYTIIASCVSDGTGGEGQNKKESKDTQH